MTIHKPTSTSVSRRRVLAWGAAAAVAAMSRPGWLTAADRAAPKSTAFDADVWMTQWEKMILNDIQRDRYCDKETGEEIGWLISPYLYGFYYGFMATQQAKWIDLLVDWSDAWMKRGSKEPDGYIGWPKADGTSTWVVPNLYTDNILGEAMALRPAVLLAGQVLNSPALKTKYGAKFKQYLDLSEQVFAKWDARCAWREVKNGGVWIVPEFGIDKDHNQWDSHYDKRKTEGFTLPDNKQNFVAEWLIAMADLTGKPEYRRRATMWWQVMKSRLHLRDGKYYDWNYWDPAGPWDYKPNHEPRHWVGIHPNGGYYDADLDGIVNAYQHKIVFEKTEIDRLIASNRDFMWNGQIQGAKFKRIDGGPPDKDPKKSPGVLWHALVPYDDTLRRIFEANHQPASWGGLIATPWYVALAAGKLKPATTPSHTL